MNILDRITKNGFTKLGSLGNNIIEATSSASRNLLRPKPRKNRNKADLSIDVASNGSTFKFLEQKEINTTDNKRMFAVEGYIYPGGTFLRYGKNRGILLNGDPEFPQDVMGTWHCKGSVIKEKSEAESGAYVITTHTYDLRTDRPGLRTLASDGLELIDLNTPFKRTLTSGTGKYNRVRGGSVTQTTIGTNNTSQFNYTFEFVFRK